jgi:hypothetical protein
MYDQSEKAGGPDWSHAEETVHSPGGGHATSPNAHASGHAPEAAGALFAGMFDGEHGPGAIAQHSTMDDLSRGVHPPNLPPEQPSRQRPIRLPQRRRRAPIPGPLGPRPYVLPPRRVNPYSGE